MSASAADNAATLQQENLRYERELLDSIIFWDIQNVPVPKDIRGYEVQRLFRETLLFNPLFPGTGTAKSIKDIIAVGSIETLAAKTRQELEESNITVVDCASTKIGSADISIVVEIMKFIFYHPPPFQICLVSSDRDFAKTLYTIASFGYEVVLIHRAKAAEVLKSAASQSYEWEWLWDNFNNVIKHRPPIVASNIFVNASSLAAAAPTNPSAHHRLNSNPLQKSSAAVMVTSSLSRQGSTSSLFQLTTQPFSASSSALNNIPVSGYASEMEDGSYASQSTASIRKLRSRVPSNGSNIVKRPGGGGGGDGSSHSRRDSGEDEYYISSPDAIDVAYEDSSEAGSPTMENNNATVLGNDLGIYATGIYKQERPKSWSTAASFGNGPFAGTGNNGTPATAAIVQFKEVVVPKITDYESASSTDEENGGTYEGFSSSYPTSKTPLKSKLGGSNSSLNSSSNNNNNNSSKPTVPSPLKAGGNNGSNNNVSSSSSNLAPRSSLGSREGISTNNKKASISTSSGGSGGGRSSVNERKSTKHTIVDHISSNTNHGNNPQISTLSGGKHTAQFAVSAMQHRVPAQPSILASDSDSSPSSSTGGSSPPNIATYPSTTSPAKNANISGGEVENKFLSRISSSLYPPSHSGLRPSTSMPNLSDFDTDNSSPSRDSVSSSLVKTSNNNGNNNNNNSAAIASSTTSAGSTPTSQVVHPAHRIVYKNIALSIIIRNAYFLPMLSKIDELCPEPNKPLPYCNLKQLLNSEALATCRTELLYAVRRGFIKISDTKSGNGSNLYLNAVPEETVTMTRKGLELFRDHEGAGDLVTQSERRKSNVVAIVNETYHLLTSIILGMMEVAEQQQQPPVQATTAGAKSKSSKQQSASVVVKVSEVLEEVLKRVKKFDTVMALEYMNEAVKNGVVVAVGSRSIEETGNMQLSISLIEKWQNNPFK